MLNFELNPLGGKHCCQHTRKQTIVLERDRLVRGWVPSAPWVPHILPSLSLLPRLLSRQRAPLRPSDAPPLGERSPPLTGSVRTSTAAADAAESDDYAPAAADTGASSVCELFTWFCSVNKRDCVF